MAKTKAAGSTKLGRDSRPKYLGLKVSHGEKVKPGQILIKQRGLKYLAGKNTGIGSDYTIYAKTEGKVVFNVRKKTKFDGSKRKATVVNVEPL